MADWLSSDSRFKMNCEQRGLYRELLDLLYLDGGSLPADEEILRRKAQIEHDEWQRSWPLVREKFTEKSGRLYHERASSVYRKSIECQIARKESASKAGTASGRSRKQAASNGRSTDVQRDVRKLTNERSTESNGRSTKTNGTSTITSTVTIPSTIPVGDIERAIAIMKSRHEKKDSLGGFLLEQVVAEKVAESTDPEGTLAQIVGRHEIACRIDWADREMKYWPNLVEWVRTDKWLDPVPNGKPAAQPEQPKDKYGYDEEDYRRFAKHGMRMGRMLEGADGTPAS